MLLGAAIGLAISVTIFGVAPRHWAQIILVHGFAGAMVGGLCDWYAVVKTYGLVERNRDAVAHEIGNWVATDLLNPQVVRGQLEGAMRDPETYQQVYRYLDRKVGTRADAIALLTNAWGRIRPQVLDFVSNYELSGSEMGRIRELFAHPDLQHNVKKCLGDALEAIATSPDFDALVSASASIGPFLRLLGVDGYVRGKARERVLALAVALRNPSAGSEDSTFIDSLEPTVRVGSAAFVEAWNALSVEDRRRGAEVVVQYLSEPFIQALASLLCRERDRLRTLSTLSEHPLARPLVDRASAAFGESLSPRLGSIVASALCKEDPATFRANLENKTRPHLENIRINGTLLGFGVNAVLGLVLAALHP